MASLFQNQRRCKSLLFRRAKGGVKGEGPWRLDQYGSQGAQAATISGESLSRISVLPLAFGGRLATHDLAQ